jgi:diketogulonate reductase-like aldo/keto reductase
MSLFCYERRNAVRRILAIATTALMWARVPAQVVTAAIDTRKIPSRRESLPILGLGSWITFNVGEDVDARDRCAAVVKAFLEGGGRLIDSSPMYGSSQSTIGFALRKLGNSGTVFAADKVWANSAMKGVSQIEETRRRWGVSKFDLLQVHNLEDWVEHLPTLFEMRASGRLRYVGVTTSHGRRMSELEQIMRSQPLDFIQLTYNILDREPEESILPLARERGIAVIANRPFREGALIDKFKRYPLPTWSHELECVSWPQFLLKFVLSHPAVSCAIPATGNVDHVRENMLAASGPLPDVRTRQRMIDYVKAL